MLNNQGYFGLQTHYRLLSGIPAAILMLALTTASFAQEITVIGKLVARQSGDIASKIAAPVESVTAIGGDKVAKGHVLASLNVDDRKADLASAMAKVRVAESQLMVRKAALELEKARYDRLDKLKTSAAFSGSRYEDSKIEVRRLQAEVAVAEAEIEARRAAADRIVIDIKGAEIYAPFNAVIVSRSVEVGDYVSAGQALFTLVSLESLEIEADVPTDIASRLKLGTELKAFTRDQEMVNATVRAVIPIENPLTRTRVVKLTLDKLKGLAIGQSVELKLNK